MPARKIELKLFYVSHPIDNEVAAGRGELQTKLSLAIRALKGSGLPHGMDMEIPSTTQDPHHALCISLEGDDISEIQQLLTQVPSFAHMFSLTINRVEGVCDYYVDRSRLVALLAERYGVPIFIPESTQPVMCSAKGG
jgi:hypothetical protein